MTTKRINLNEKTAQRIEAILEQQQRLQIALQQIELTARELLDVPEDWRLVREEGLAFVESVEREKETEGE